MAGSTRKCLGFTRDFRRCNHPVNGFEMFCHYHRFKPVAWLLYLLFTVIPALIAINGVGLFGETLKKPTDNISMHKTRKEYPAAERISQELQEKGLVAKLAEANGYVRGRNFSGEEKALDLYSKVDAALSSQAHKKLEEHSGLLKKAEDDAKRGFIENSVQEYRALFASIGYDDRTLTE